MNREISELAQVTDRLDAVLLMTGNALTKAIGQPPSMWIVDADPTRCAGALLQRSLAFLGISNTREIAVDALGSINLEDRSQVSPLIVSLSFTGEPIDQNAVIEDWCEKESIPWVRAVVDLSMGYADAGPISLAGRTPCYKCFTKHYLTGRKNVVGVLPHSSAVAFWCNVLAPSLVDIYRQAKRSYVPDGFKRYNLTTLEYNYLRRTSLPGCSCRQATQNGNCGLTVGPIQENASPNALIYEDCVGKEYPYRPQPTDAHNFVSKSLTIRLFPNSASLALPRVPPLGNMGVAELLEANGPHRLHPLALDDLVAIVFYSLGLRSVDVSRSNACRWAASAGNLGSADIFVLANGVQGLAPGLYHYRSIAHDLVTLDLRQGTGWAEHLSSSSDAEAFLCFTGSYHRLQHKYGTFGYRLVHLDAGVAFSQASLIARSLGAHLTVIPNVDESLVTSSLNLSRMREHLTLVTRLSLQKPAYDSTLGYPHQVPQSQIGISLGCPVDTFGQLPSRGLADALYLESMKTVSCSTSHPARMSQVGDPNCMMHAESSFGVHATNLTLMDVLSKRVSVRKFTREEVSQDMLKAILKATYDADIAEWPEEYLGNRALRFFLLQNKKDGRKTVYEYQHNNMALNLVKTIPPSDALKSLYVDMPFQDAPAAIWIVGNLEKAIEAHGSYGHRQLLFRSGAAANRLWLTAISLGIAGTISAGLLPRTARQILNFDGWTRLPLCAFLAGVPADDVTQ